MKKPKTFKKDQEVFVVSNQGSHWTVHLEKVFRFEEAGKGEIRVFMYSNTSACVLSKDIYTDEREAEHEAVRRTKRGER